MEKTLPDGTKKRYRQRRPGGNVPMVEEGPVYYQEEEVDENNPEDDKYDPEVCFLLKNYSNDQEIFPGCD